MDVKFGLAPGTSAAEHAAAVANGGELVDRAVVIVRPVTREPDTATQEGATPICSSDDNAAAQRDEVRLPRYVHTRRVASLSLACEG
jgi:hypothetical protein